MASQRIAYDFLPFILFSSCWSAVFFLSSKKQRYWSYVVLVTSSTVLFYRYEVRWNVQTPPTTTLQGDSVAK